MLRKLWKILWISALSLIGFFVIVGILVNIFVPEEELKKASVPPPEQQVSPPEPTEPPPPPIEYKRVNWDRTPEEQRLKVGDWITAQGQPDGLVGALRKFKGDLRKLYDIDPLSGDYFLSPLRNNVVQVFELDYGENGSLGVIRSLGVIPAKSPLPPNIKIRSVVVFKIPNPAENPVFKQFNQLRLHGLDSITDIILRGQIRRITSPEDKDGHPRQALWMEDERCTFQLTASPEQIAHAMQQAKANAAAVKQKFDQLRSQFSLWDGSHENTVKYIKERMNNPKSFEHVRTTFTTDEAEGYRLINMTYRGTNVYNAIITNTIRVKVTLEGRVIGVVSSQ